MAILYGTQSNGETLPVLVDQFGNLLAKGIDGGQGPPGEQGEQGEPGLIQWPPNPQEDDVITYKNGEVVWASSVVPPPTRWSQYMTSNNGAWTAGMGPTKAFDGLSSTNAYTEGDGPLYFAPPEIQILTLQMSFLTNNAKDGYRYEAKCGNIVQEFEQNGDTEWIFSYNRFAGVTINESTPLEVSWWRRTPSKANGNVSRIWINGVLLIDNASLRAQAALINRINSSNPD